MPVLTEEKAALGAAALAGYALGWGHGFKAAKSIWERV